MDKKMHAPGPLDHPRIENGLIVAGNPRLLDHLAEDASRYIDRHAVHAYCARCRDWQRHARWTTPNGQTRQQCEDCGFIPTDGGSE